MHKYIYCDLHLWEKLMTTAVYTISDLHLEFLITKNGIEPNKEILNNIYYPLLTPLDRHEKNILLLGGDICTAKHYHYVLPLFERLIVEGHYDKIYAVLGNHEFWGYHWVESFAKIKRQIEQSPILKDKFFILENETVNLTNTVQLIANTLWYSVPISHEYVIEKEINDYRYITVKYNTMNDKPFYRKINYINVYQRYQKSIQYIHDSLVLGSEKGKQSIVLTHHAPSHLFIKGTKYEQKINSVYGYGTPLPYSFRSPDVCIENIIKWIHGHAHHTIYREYVNELGIDIVTNTVGYWNDEFFGDIELNHVSKSKILLD